MMIPKLNRTLQVRRMTTKYYDAVPLDVVKDICNKTIEKLHEQNLNLIKDYKIYKISADKYIQRYRKTDFIDGNKIIDEFKNEENPYLFFTPMYSWLAAGNEQTLQQRVCLGYGESGVAMLDFDTDYFRSTHSNEAHIDFCDTKLALHKIIGAVLHEDGHSLYRLGNHKYKYCAMSLTTNTAHYCMRCKKKAKKLESLINKS
jgi:hypothetical protein